MTWLMLALMLALSSPSAFGQTPYSPHMMATSSPFQTVRDYLSGATTTVPSLVTLRAEIPYIYTASWRARRDDTIDYWRSRLTSCPLRIKRAGWWGGWPAHYLSCGTLWGGGREGSGWGYATTSSTRINNLPVKRLSERYPPGVLWAAVIYGAGRRECAREYSPLGACLYTDLGIACSNLDEHQGIHLHCTNHLGLTPPQPLAQWELYPPEPAPTPEPEPTATSTRAWLEVPANGSFQSGIGFVSGWVCEAERVSIVIDGGLHLPPVARNIARGDTEAVCGDTNNGFITQWNWNLLGEGTYTAALVVNGQTMQTNTFTVTTMGQEFIRGLERDVEVQDFPSAGEITRLRWQEPVQGFVLVPGSEPTPTPEPTATSTRARLEVPDNGSFQSGIGYVSGWACEGELVEIVIDGGLRIPPVARNISRGDTEAACGDQTNGFITQWNWNLLGEGTYTAALVIDGRTIQENRFTVTTLGEEFVRGVERDVEVQDFPGPGENTRLRWQEPVQGFVLVPGSTD